jgi:outer membrane protein assembly factor BamE
MLQRFESIHLKSILASLAILITSACQTSVVKQFESIKPGMEKNDVIGLMGSPNQTLRVHGKDRWYYNFYEDKIRFEKEVQFINGITVYVGEVSQSPVVESANAQDARNIESDRQQSEIQITKQSEQARTRGDYENYNAKIKGEDKVHYLPNFVPIR